MSTDNPKSYFSLERKASSAYLKLGLFVLLLIFLTVASAFVFPVKRERKNLISPGFFQSFNLTSTFNFVFKSEDLSKIVQRNIEGKEGEYAVYIEDLSDGESYSLRSLDSFPAASLYKLYLMAAVLKEVDSGQLTVDSLVSAKKSHLVEIYGGVDFGYEEIAEDGVIEYSVEEALTRVGRISDNFAAIMLMDKIGRRKVQSVIDSTSATSTNLKSPITTSASDIGIFLKALYNGEVVNKAVSEKLIEFLSLNQLNNRIPAGIRSAFAEASADKEVGDVGEVRVIHKTGELAGVRHDAGIVYISEKLGKTQTASDSEDQTNRNSDLSGTPSPSELFRTAYIIVLMSKDLKYEDEGVETLAKISKEVFEYFQKKE